MSNLKILDLIEKKYALKKHSSWGFLRSTYAHTIRLNQFLSQDNERNNKSDIIYRHLRILFLGFRNWFRKYNYIIFDVSDDYKNIDGVYKSRLTDQITNSLGNKHFLHIQTTWTGKKIKSNDYIVNNSVFLFLVSIISIFYKQNKIEDVYKQINIELNQEINYQGIYNKVFIKKSLIKLLLRIYKPKFIIVTCFTLRAEIIAAKELQIPVIEIQHGISHHNSYYGENFIPQAQPDYILVFGEKDKTFIESTNYIENTENIIVVGSSLVNVALESKNDFLKIYKKKYRKVISISIQDLLLKETLNFIEKSSALLPDIMFIIIPRNKIINNIFHDNVMISYEDCLKTIRFSDLHLSIFSTCLLEAPSLGVPNIFWNYDELSIKYFKEYIESKDYNFLINNEVQLKQLLEKNINIQNHSIIESNKDYFIANYDENIEYFLEKLRNDQRL